MFAKLQNADAVLIEMIRRIDPAIPYQQVIKELEIHPEYPSSLVLTKKCNHWLQKYWMSLINQNTVKWIKSGYRIGMAQIKATPALLVNECSLAQSLPNTKYLLAQQ